MSEELSEQIKQIEDALDRLVTTAIFEDLRWAQQEGRARFRFTSCEELHLLSEEDELTREIVNRPLRGACGLAIRLLGQRLFDLTGSTKAMGEAIERVANRDPKSYGCRVDIISTRWEGLGSDGNRWWS